MVVVVVVTGEWLDKGSGGRLWGGGGKGMLLKMGEKGGGEGKGA